MKLSKHTRLHVRTFIVFVYPVIVSTCGTSPNCCTNFYSSKDSHCVACQTGYFGPNCSLPCRYPNYGLQCQFECKCEQKQYCNHITGCQSTIDGTAWPVDINGTSKDADCLSRRRNEDSLWSFREKSMLVTIIILAVISVLIMAIYFNFNIRKYERWNYFIHYIEGNVNDRNEISIL
uniref:Cell death abnormality protein 1-like isoform X1 n=1 Tax=Crassostrea virginica TaxID=6565 RepID=A0A8B8B040_CRAVI|nr:cell death abnormality protein 1-like isoform X1 [Crassostrea virginica]